MQNLEDLELVDFGRAFMPAVPEGRPIMDRVPSEILGSACALGVFLNFGHDLDGFTLGLGSGKVMAELVLGEQPSIDMSPFRLPQREARCCTVL